jgi:hypothetical protein
LECEAAMMVWEIIEGLQYQGTTERIQYLYDCSEWGSNPTGIAITITRMSDGVDVTALMATGAPSVLDATHILTPVVHSLELDVEYRMNIHYTANGQELEDHAFILGM